MDTIDLLTRFTLTKQEATIYMTMFAEGPLTGYEVSKLTGISRSNTYTALAGLVDKGATYVIEGAATRYTPLPLEEFCNNKIRELQDCKQALIENMPSKRGDTDGYITIKGQKHIIDKMKTMLDEAKERVYLSVPLGTFEEILPQLEAAVSRKLKVVVIINSPVELPDATIYLTDKEPQIRLIADSSNVLTGDIKDGSSSTCLYSKKKNLVDLIKESLKNEIRIIELTKGMGK